MENTPESRKTILLVDDVELFLQLQISYLGNKRFDIYTARSGSEALGMAQELKPDLVLLDMFMPDMTGDVVCRILKSQPSTSSIPVVIVSSGGREDSRKRAENAGCDGLIYKPVRKDLLLSVVEKCLGINLRREHRIRVKLPVTVGLEGEEAGATIYSISAEGVFIGIEKGKAIVGDLLQLRFTLPEIGERVEVRNAAVVWEGILGTNGPRGVGVQFLSIFPETADHIRKYIKSTTEKISYENGEIAGSNI